MQDTTRVDDVAVRVDAIAQAFVTHWSHFGRYPGSSLHDEDGVLWYESPIAHLPYNAVIRSHVTGDTDAVVARVTERFRARGVPFMWVVRPGDTPADLGARCAAAGLAHVEEATGMDLDLEGWQPDAMPAGVEVVEALDDTRLHHYEELIRTYWAVPDEAREMIQTLNRYWSGARGPGTRFVAYVDGRPVGKLFLNLLELPVAAVYGVAVVPEARGRGVAGALMAAALERSVALGATRAVLHSSPMARSLYGRMGFAERCRFDVYATTTLFGTHHH